MRGVWTLFCLFALTTAVEASWYWPFGSNDDEPDKVRLSTLIEPASELIDEASDLAADGKVQESVEKYRKALEELDRIELENPERAKSQEFATVRNKRAYVNAAIDAMLLSQVRNNAKAVAVSDTTELEKKLAAERKAKDEAKKPVEAKAKEEPKKAESKSEPEVKPEAKPAEKKAVEPVAKPTAPRPKDEKERVAYDIANKDFEDAMAVVSEMLVKKPNDPKALNLKAAVELSQGKFKDAEATLDQAIMSNPRNHYAYYNMALLVLKIDPSRKTVARRYYETGRAVGGPEDRDLEELVK